MPTSPTSGPGGSSGGGLTEQHAAYFGSAVSVNNNGSNRLTWNTKVDGTELFDRTDTARPAVLAAGVYIVSIEAAPQAALTAGGSYELQLILDASGAGIQLDTETGAALDPTGQPSASLSSAYHIPIGGTVEILVVNHDGVAARNFSLLSAAVQRLA